MFLTSVLTIASLLGGHYEENHVFRTLLDEGSGSSLPYPKPTLADGMDADEQQAALEALFDRPAKLELLRRATITAPFELRVKRSDEGVARTVDLWFFVRSDLDTVSDTQLLLDFLGVNGQPEPGEMADSLKFLDDEAIRKVGASIPENPEAEGWAFGSFDFLDRVVIEGLTHGMKTRTDDSILFAARMSDRGKDYEEYANRWRSVDRNRLGETVIGEPSPYGGFGVYVKATPLREPGDLVLIEAHVRFDEPEGWFDGANLLRSKLPLLIREQVFRYRRRLKKLGP